MSYDIKISDLTNSSKSNDGDGVYDLLSQAVVKQIESQYKEGRLKGTDYANVLLGSIQSVLAESVRFVLTEKTSEGQAALLAEQVNSEIKNNELDGVIDKQKEKIISDISLTDTQITKVSAEKLLVDEQRTELGLNGTSQRLVNTAQISKINNESLLVTEQTVSETKQNELNGLIDKQKAKIDEDISASQAESNRRNLLNSAEIAHREKETILVTSQEQELVLNGVAERNLSNAKKASIESESLDRTNKTTADIALVNTQVTKVSSEKALVDAQAAEIAADALSQRSVNTSQIDKLASEKTLLDTKNAATAAETVRADAESAQRVLLMQAQTIGFKTDAKQKLMRQLYEGYSVNVTTAGAVSTPPNGSAASALDQVANDILDDLGSTVNIPTTYETP